MIAQRVLKIPSIRNLEMDQIAVKVLYNPSKRDILLNSIKPYHKPIMELKHCVDYYLGAKGCDTHYSYVPDRLLVRRIYEGLDNIVRKGILEYSKINKDKRGHFFDLDDSYSLPIGENDAILVLSNFRANMWAAEERFQLAEDVVSEDQPGIIPSIRVYTHNKFDNDVVPDISLFDIDLIAVTKRSKDSRNALIAMAPKSIRSYINHILFEVDSTKTDENSVIPQVLNVLQERGCRHFQQEKYLLLNPEKVFFWEMQKHLCFPEFDWTFDYDKFKTGIGLIRNIIRQDPKFWGKTTEWFYDPFGIINYILKNSSPELYYK